MLEQAKKQGTLTGQQIADAIVKVLNDKGQGPLAEQANNLTAIWARFKENVVRLFEDVTKSSGFKEFLTGIKQLFGLFDQSTASAKAMHAGIVGALSAVFSMAAKVLPYVRKGIELLIIYTLKAYIAFKTWRSEGSKWSPILKTLAADVKLAAVYMMGLASAFATVFEVGSKVASIGQQIDDGLAKGIAGGAGTVISAIKGLGATALAALKSSLAIASPSKEFAKLGAHAAAGFSAGLQGGGGIVAASSSRMASSATEGAKSGTKPAAPSATAGSSQSARGGGMIINIMPGAIVISGAQGDASELTETALSALLERIALQQGLGGT
jgi:hypothetical protein